MVKVKNHPLLKEAALKVIDLVQKVLKMMKNQTIVKDQDHIRDLDRNSAIQNAQSVKAIVKVVNHLILNNSKRDANILNLNRRNLVINPKNQKKTRVL